MKLMRKCTSQVHAHHPWKGLSEFQLAVTVQKHRKKSDTHLSTQKALHQYVSIDIKMGRDRHKVL